MDVIKAGYELSHYLVNFYDETQQRSNETILSWKDTANLLK
jgi:hypothetical protein